MVRAQWRPRPHLVPYVGRFDGFHSKPACVPKTGKLRFESDEDRELIRGIKSLRRKCLVLATAVCRPVEVHACAERIVIRQDGVVVGEHARAFGRGQPVHHPWHHVVALARKPGVLRHGAPFKDRVPPAIAAIRRKLNGSGGADRQPCGERSFRLSANRWPRS